MNSNIIDSALLFTTRSTTEDTLKQNTDHQVAGTSSTHCSYHTPCYAEKGLAKTKLTEPKSSIYPGRIPGNSPGMLSYIATCSRIKLKWEPLKALDSQWTGTRYFTTAVFY